MFEKIPRNIPEDFRECCRRFHRIFGKILGNVQEDSRECFQFQINQSHVLLKKKQMLSYSRRRDLSLLYLINNRKIKQNNLISSYFHFFWNSNWKEIAATIGKSWNQEELKAKINRRSKWMKEMKVIFVDLI